MKKNKVQNLQNKELDMEVKAKIFGKDIGVLSQKNGGYFFQYFNSFLETKLEISPFYLPLSPRVFSGREFMAFELIPSVFADSLPDSFGYKLMAEYFSYHDNSYEAMKNPLQKLSYMGDRAIGAISYEPILRDSQKSIALELREYIKNTRKIIEGSSSDVIKELCATPSPGGARPKAFISWDRKNDHLLVGKTKEGYEEWIVKFYENDKLHKDLTKIEYIYFQIAKNLGLNTPNFDKILDEDEFHFAVKRFDREAGKKLHIHTLSGLLNKRFDERGVFTYEELLKVTLRLTNNFQDVEEAYKRMVFNVIGKSCDDHAKNFSFIMTEDGKWKLAPVYDIVYSFGGSIYQEHFLSVRSKTMDITDHDMILLAIENGISKSKAKEIIQNTKDAFSDFYRFAKNLDIDKEIISQVKIC